MYVDKHWIGRHFKVGDLVFLLLQSYIQSTLKQKGVEKLKSHFYGPYRVIRRVGEVAYELELPPGRKLHNVFHVSCLKKALGKQVKIAAEVPPLDDEGHSILVLEAILEEREKKLRNRTIKEFLVKWEDLPEEEREQVLEHPTLQFLKDTQNLGEEDCHCPQ